MASLDDVCVCGHVKLIHGGAQNQVCWAVTDDELCDCQGFRLPDTGFEMLPVIPVSLELPAPPPKGEYDYRMTECRWINRVDHFEARVREGWEPVNMAVDGNAWTFVWRKNR